MIFPGSVPVFYQGLNGSKCFRIPSIIKTSEGTLLAFSENRVTDCGDNGPHHALVLRRSTDNGKTWGPMTTVVEGTSPCPGCPAAISNPNPVEVSLPSGKTAILMSYDTMNNPNMKHHGLDMAHFKRGHMRWSQCFHGRHERRRNGIENSNQSRGNGMGGATHRLRI